MVDVDDDVDGDETWRETLVKCYCLGFDRGPVFDNKNNRNNKKQRAHWSIPGMGTSPYGGAEKSFTHRPNKLGGYCLSLALRRPSKRDRIGKGQTTSFTASQLLPLGRRSHVEVV